MLTAFLYPILRGTLCLRAIQWQPEFILVTLPHRARGKRPFCKHSHFKDDTSKHLMCAMSVIGFLLCLQRRGGAGV